MRIIIIANFPADIDGGKAKGRFLYLGEMLCDRGHQVEMIVSDFVHGKKHHREKNSIKQDAYKTKITVLHEPGYHTNVSIKRLWSHYIWGRNVMKYINCINIPDVVYCAMPSLTAAKKAADYCRKNNVKFVVDLQDLWPEAFAMVIKNKILQKVLLPMKWMANKAYSSADLAIAVSDTYVKRVIEVNKKIHSGLAVFLGNDGKVFDMGKAKYHLVRSQEEIVIGYVGNMSKSYDIPCIFNALAKVKTRGHIQVPIRFVLIGGGVDEAKFKAYASKTYPNTDFLGYKGYQEMAGMLCDCDIVVNPIVKGSVASIINKVGDYALAGKPVINTQESPEYRHLVDSYKCGINCECGNSNEVADALEKLAKDPELRQTMGENARRFGIEKFDRRHTYQIIVEAIEQSTEGL